MPSVVTSNVMSALKLCDVIHLIFAIGLSVRPVVKASNAGQLLEMTNFDHDHWSAKISIWKISKNINAHSL